MNLRARTGLLYDIWCDLCTGNVTTAVICTTMMMLPIATAVCDHVTRDSPEIGDRLSPVLLLAIAYSASIGGIGTIIGTAPNVFVVSFIQSQMGREISFLNWMMVALPLVLVFLPLCWWLLCRVIFSVSKAGLPDIDALLQKLNSELGPMRREEVLTLIIFLLTAVSWVVRPMLNQVNIGGVFPLAGLTDSGIAVISALILFVTPVRISTGQFLMNWDTAVKLPWGLLILFGGGLSLAAALDSTGFSQFLGGSASVLAALPTILVVALVVVMMIFLTEMTSNTATTATLIPVLYAVAVGLGINPFMLILPAGIAASCAFMLPVATPPNAIVFGSGMVTIPQMSRAGLLMNILGIVLITLLTYVVVIPAIQIFG
jgi:sodium-dependent dicarboxylate transporter 2/3/5